MQCSMMMGYDEDEAAYAAGPFRIGHALSCVEEGWDPVDPRPSQSKEDQDRASWFREKREDPAIGDHPLLQEAECWAIRLGDLLADPDIWRQKGADLAQQSQLGIRTPEEVFREAELITDCRQVLVRYRFFIGYKFRWALEARSSASDLQNVAQSSAGIALRAVAYALMAMKQLFCFIPDEERMLPLLASLEKLQRMGRELFPEAGECRDTPV